VAFVLWILAVILVVSGILAVVRKAVPVGHRPHRRRPAGRPRGRQRLHV